MNLDKDKLVTLYWQDRLTQVEIANELDVGTGTVSREMNKHGIPKLKFWDRDRKGYKQEKVLRHLYHDELLTTVEIAELFGVTNPTIGSWMERNNIPRRKAGWNSASRQVRADGAGDDWPPDDFDEDDVPEAGGGEEYNEEGQHKNVEDVEQRTPGELTPKDVLKCRIMITGFNDSNYRDVAVSDIGAGLGVRPLTDHFRSHALDILLNEGVVKPARKVGNASTFELVGEESDLSFSHLKIEDVKEVVTDCTITEDELNGFDQTV